MRKSSKIFTDPRVRQFHDPDKKVGNAFAPGLISPGRGPAWDIYLFYDSNAVWKEQPPAPITFAHRLVKRQAEVRKAGILPWLRPDSGSAPARGLRHVDSRTRMQRIRETIREIPQGRVASYGQIAEIAGVPRGARQVGYALRHLPQGHDVPWYRVIRASGRIALEKGSDGFNEQSKRLMMENVTILEGRIDMQKYRWQPDLDELLWKPNAAWDGD